MKTLVAIFKFSPFRRHLKDDKTSRHVDLRGRKAGAIGINQGFHHVPDQLAYRRRGGIFYRLSHLSQNRVPHAGNFQNSHKTQYGLGPLQRKANADPRARDANMTSNASI